MQETNEQQRIYSMMQNAVYFFVLMECAILFLSNKDIPILSALLIKFGNMPIFFPPLNAKFTQVFLILLVSIGTKAKKKLNINIGKSIVLPIVVGSLMMFGTQLLIDPMFDPNAYRFIPYLNVYEILYILFSIFGAVILMVGTDSISKIIKSKLGKDKWNVEQESFDQNRELVETDYSINIPYSFYYKNKMNDGWLNVNPFRGGMVVGTPGSGKSFSIINPAIRQLVKKGFSLCIYDFKFPDLAKIAYYHYLDKKKRDKNYKHSFHVINLDHVERSRRINPLKREYVETLAQVQEISEAIVIALQKGGGGGGGSQQYFTESAISFLAGCIGFLANYENGRYSTLAHLLAMLNRPYEEIFNALFSNEELHSLLSAFVTAYKNKAFDQLEGQVSTLKIPLSRLASKESYWVFSGDEIDLKISRKDNPSIVILASDPNTQTINSNLYSAVLNRILSLINTKGNLPSGVIADELPTIYIHKIDNLIATARSNKVAVLLGLQELTQFRQFYKKEVADTVVSVIGNVFSGAVRDRQTLEWIEKIGGKVKQQSHSMSINNNQTTYSIQERMDSLLPSGKVTSLTTGEMVGIIARDEGLSMSEYTTSAFNGKINVSEKELAKEEKGYKELPTYANFTDKDGVDRKNEILLMNFRRINAEMELIMKEFTP